MNYYNENNPDAAAWLRELIRADHIAPGFVDERSIVDVKADKLGQYTQCHFFAGIGGWPLALRLAGWPDERRAWTGSCPCQPFSQIGKRQLDKDARNLWPALRGAIKIGKPTIVFGEQVASKDGRIWLSGIRTDLEAMGYEVGAADLCAAASPLRTCAKGFTGWPTASSRDWKDTPGMATEGVNPDGTKRKRLDQLPRVAALTGWGTPRVANNGGHGNVSRSADGMSRLEDQVHGITTNQSNAVMGKPAAFLLNPRFSLWLQGYPAMWSYCGEQAMQSSHNSRRRSSKPATK